MTPQPKLHRFHPNVSHIEFDRLMEIEQQFVELETNVPQIFYIWGHSYEMDIHSNYWNQLEFFKLISNRDDIFYGTN